MNRATLVGLAAVGLAIVLILILVAKVGWENVVAWFFVSLFIAIVAAFFLILFLAVFWRILLPGAVVLAPLIIGIALCAFLCYVNWSNLAIFALVVWIGVQVVWGMGIPWKETGEDYHEWLKEYSWVNPLDLIGGVMDKWKW